MVHAGAFDVPPIGFPYCSAIGVRHDLVTWKVIYILVRAHSWATARRRDLAQVLATTMSMDEKVFIKGTGETVTIT